MSTFKESEASAQHSVFEQAIGKSCEAHPAAPGKNVRSSARAAYPGCSGLSSVFVYRSALLLVGTVPETGRRRKRNWMLLPVAMEESRRNADIPRSDETVRDPLSGQS